MLRLLGVSSDLGFGTRRFQPVQVFAALIMITCFPPLVAAQAITGINPFRGQPGDVVTIGGIGFAPSAGQNEVRFGPNRAPVRSATVTQLVVQVPNGQPLGTTTVTVTVGGTRSNARSFIVITRSQIAMPPNPPHWLCCEMMETNTSPCKSEAAHLGGTIGGQKAGNIYSERGELFQYETDLFIPGRPDAEPMLHFAFRRHYRSAVNIDGPLGYNWSHNYYERLFVQIDGTVVHNDGLGRNDHYRLNNLGEFVAPPELFTELKKNADGTFELRYRGGTAKKFAEDGRILAIRDRKSNLMTFYYGSQSQLIRINDTLGRDIIYRYILEGPHAGRLQEIEDFVGRKIRFDFDALGDLVQVTSPAVTGTPTGNDFPAGKTTRYTYASGFADPRINHNLLTITRPTEVASGGPPVLDLRERLQDAIPFGYGTDPNTLGFDRVIRQTYGGVKSSVSAGGTFAYAYERLNIGVQSDDPNLVVSRTTETDRRGLKEDYEYNRLGYPVVRREFTQGVRPTDPPYFETRMEYNTDGQLVRKILPEGNSILYFYDEANADRLQQGNLLAEMRIPDASRGGSHMCPPAFNTLGTIKSCLLTTYTYEPRFNQIKTITDPRGNDPGYTPPNGGAASSARYTTTFTFDYEVKGDPALNPEGFEHGNRVRKQDPSVRLLDGSLQVIMTEYNFNRFGQRIREIDPEGNVNEFRYFAESDPDGDGNTGPGTRPGLDSNSGGYLKETMVDFSASPRRKEASSPVQISNRFFYDPVGNVVMTIDGRGIGTVFAVNQLNHVVETRKAASVAAVGGGSPPEPLALVPFRYRERAIYDSSNNVVRREIEDFGNTSNTGGFVDQTYKYDILDNMIEMAQEVNINETLITRYGYDRSENRTVVVEPEGNATTFFYDERDLIYQTRRGADFATSAHATTPPLGGRYPGRGEGVPSTESVIYDKNKNPFPASGVDAADTDRSGGNNTMIVATQEGVESHIGDGSGNVYDGFDRRIESRDPVGNVICWDYDPTGNVIRTVRLGSAGGPSPINPSASACPRPPLDPSSTNGILSATEYAHDELNRLFQEDKLLFMTGVATQRQSSLTEGPLTPGDGRVSTRYTYDRNSRRTATIEDDLATYRMEYDGADRVVRTIDPEGNSVEIAYDDNNNVIEKRETDISQVPGVPNELFVTTSFHDSLNRLQQSVDNIGQTFHYRYDSRNNLVAMADAEGPPGPSIARRAFAGGAHTINQTNAFGNVTLYSYDGFNRKTREEKVLTASGRGDGVNIGANIYGEKAATPPPDPNQSLDGIVTSRYEWDGSSLMVSMTDDNGNRTRYTYDNLNRRVKEEKGLSGSSTTSATTITHQYDLDDNVETLVDENRSEKTCRFDAINRLVDCDIRPRIGLIGTTQVTYQYDGLDRLTFATDNNDPDDPTDDSIITYAYDSLSRVTEETQQIGAFPRRAISSAWTADDRRVGLIYPNGRTLRYTFDDLDRLRTVADSASQQSIAQYDYIGSDRVLQRIYPVNGTRATFLDNLTTDIGYDGLRRPVHLRHLRSNGSLITGFAINYDRMNNKLGESPLHNLVNSEQYTHDSVYRLVQFARPNPGAISPVHRNWTLDGVGNWQRVDNEIRHHSPFNELVTRGGINLIYDSNGNLIDDGTFVFAWDYEDRLRRVTLKADGSRIADYAYDHMNRRIRKRFSSSAQDESRDFYYDNWQVVEERESISDRLLQQYVYGISLNEPLVLDRNRDSDDSATSAGDQRLFYHQNTLSSTFALTDATARTMEGYQYDAYGSPTFFEPGPNGIVDFGGDDVIRGGSSMAGRSGVANSYLFTGSRFDSESRVYYSRHRYYDAILGRFISRDPAGPVDGMGLYEYARSQPASKLDPMGLQCTGVPDRAGGLFDFGNACEKHDNCYSRCGSSRLGCDAKFLGDMVSSCTNSVCGLVATAYYIGVSVFGWLFHAGGCGEAAVCLPRLAGFPHMFGGGPSFPVPQHLPLGPGMPGVAVTGGDVVMNTPPDVEWECIPKSIVTPPIPDLNSLQQRAFGTRMVVAEGTQQKRRPRLPWVLPRPRPSDREFEPLGERRRRIPIPVPDWPRRPGPTAPIPMPGLR